MIAEYRSMLQEHWKRKREEEEAEELETGVVQEGEGEEEEDDPEDAAGDPAEQAPQPSEPKPVKSSDQIKPAKKQNNSQPAKQGSQPQDKKQPQKEANENQNEEVKVPYVSKVLAQLSHHAADVEGSQPVKVVENAENPESAQPEISENFPVDYMPGGAIPQVEDKPMDSGP